MKKVSTRKSSKHKLFEERSKKLVDFSDLQNLSKKLKKNNKKVVFTTGSFELLTPGHCRYLAEAKAKGDILVVGVGTDESIRRMKGEGYPLVPEDIRAEVVSYIKTVDYVTIVDEDRPHAFLILLQPDIFFTSKNTDENGGKDEQDKAVINMYGGKVINRKKEEPYFGSHSLVERIADIRVVQILENYLKEKIPAFDVDANLVPADFGKQIPNDKKSFDVSCLIKPLDKLIEEIGRKKKVVFVAGSYDLLHVGHARFIEKAGLLGDILVVGIPSDRSIKRTKGVGRPVISEYSRAYTLGHLDPVDYVMIFDEDTVCATLEKLRPDVFYTVREDWNKGYRKSPEYKAVTTYGGKVVSGKKESPHMSASAIIDKVAKKRVVDIFRDCMDEERYNKILMEKSRLNGK